MGRAGGRGSGRSFVVLGCLVDGFSGDACLWFGAGPQQVSEGVDVHVVSHYMVEGVPSGEFGAPVVDEDFADHVFSLVGGVGVHSLDSG